MCRIFESDANEYPKIFKTLDGPVPRKGIRSTTFEPYEILPLSLRGVTLFEIRILRSRDSGSRRCPVGFSDTRG